jgi:hypothetical protein
MKSIPVFSCFLTLALFSLSSCATIFSRSHYPVYIHSEPVGATFTITSEQKGLVFEGETPSNVKLKASSGIFRKAKYAIRFTEEGYEEEVYALNASIDPWYFGNLALGVGGLTGILVVDPITGAMYKLKTPLIKVNLMPKTGHASTTNLRIIGIDEIPAEWLP